MLEGISVNMYGHDVAHLNRLFTVGGAVSISSTTETAISIASANEYGYMCCLRAECIVAGTTAGTWRLRLGLGGTTALYLQQPLPAAPVGTCYCWPFPTPWKTETKGGVFSIEANVGTLGTWVFLVNGFCSST